MSRVLMRRASVGLAVGLLVCLPASPVQAQSPGIEGTITDADTGAPIAGAFVEAYTPQGFVAGGVNTDATGHYDLVFLSTGEYRIHVLANNYEDQWAFGKGDFASADPVSSPGMADVALVPFRFGSVAGRIVTESGAPLPDTFVEISDLSGNPQDSTASDAAGGFRFTGLRTGQYRLFFRQPGGQEQWYARKRDFFQADLITVLADQETFVEEIVLPTGNLEIHLTDSATGAPVTQACAFSQSGPQFFFECADATGTIRVNDMAAGTYDVFITSEEYLNNVAEDVVVRPSETTIVSVALDRPGKILVTVRDRATNLPVSGVCIRLVETGGTNILGPRHSFCSNPEGRVTIGPLFPDSFRLFAHPTDETYGMQWVTANGGSGQLEKARVFDIQFGTTVEVDVRLDRAGSISGVVRDRVTGQPVAGICTAPVPVFNRQTEPVSNNCTDTEGRYTLSGLGPYEWPVIYPDYRGGYAWEWLGGTPDRRESRLVKVDAGRTKTANHQLRSAGQLTGRIVNSQLPPFFVTIDAVNARTGEYIAPEGTVTSSFVYTFRGLATQRITILYNVLQGAEGLTRYPFPVQVYAGQTVTGPDLGPPSA